MDQKTQKVTGLPTLLARRTTRTESGNGTGGTGGAEKLHWRLKKRRWTEESVLPKANILKNQREKGQEDQMVVYFSRSKEN